MEQTLVLLWEAGLSSCTYDGEIPESNIFNMVIMANEGTDFRTRK